jgi:hypothetical protein
MSALKYIPLLSCFVLAGMGLPGPGHAQGLRGAGKVAAAVYEAGQERGLGYGGSARVTRGIARSLIRAELGYYRLSALDQKCVTSGPGVCSPVTPPRNVIDLRAGAFSQVGSWVEVGAGFGGYLRDYSARDRFDPAVFGSIALPVSKTGVPTVEVSYSRIIGEQSGWLATLGLVIL